MIEKRSHGPTKIDGKFRAGAWLFRPAQTRHVFLATSLRAAEPERPDISKAPNENQRHYGALYLVREVAKEYDHSAGGTYGKKQQ